MSATTPHATILALRRILCSQYHAGLAMLRQAIERTPDDLWVSPAYPTRTWQLAYHTLFFTHLYLQPDEQAFRPWPKHVADVQYPDGIPGPADPESHRPLVAEPYSRAAVLEYREHVDGMVDAMVESLDLLSEESGFHWYPVSKLEHQLINLRHLQHGAAQLADRLRAACDLGIDWVGARR
jgi:hypothetical protein